jgi:hypothetical protein
MKLTLRKANAIQHSIKEETKAIKLDSDAILNEFEPVTDQINNVRDQFFDNLDRHTKLTDALYEIRKKVASVNADSGINDLLAKVANLEKTISVNATLVARGVQTSSAVIEGKLKKNADTKDEYGYRNAAVVTSIFTEAEVEGFRQIVALSKREKQKIQDQLLELNVRSEIELDASTAEFLVKEGIL